jgi:RND superfamily putative drug exporter
VNALTRFVLSHKPLVVAFWLLVAGAGVLTIGSTTKRMTNSFAMPGPAARINARIVALYGNGGDQTPYVAVLTAPAGERISDPTVAAESGRIFGAARIGPHVRIVDYATTHDRAFLTRGARSTFALIFTPPESYGSTGISGELRHAIDRAAPAGWRPGLTGESLLSLGSPNSKGLGLMLESMIGGLGALVVLVFVFASFLAFLPLLVGGISVLATFLLVGGLTHLTAVSQIVEFLIALIGLGVAIDYSLLVVSRWREERSHGASNDEAVSAAMAHAGRAVVFSGLTVALSLLCLVVLPVPMLRSVGYGGVLIPLVSVAVAVTLLPVILASVGPRLDWPRLRNERSASRFWSGWAEAVYRRRWIAALAGLAIVAAVALPARGLRVGEPGSNALATAGPAHQALTTLTRGGVPAGILTPIEILVHGSGSAVVAQLDSVSGVDAALAPTTADYRRDRTTIVTVLPKIESLLPQGQTTVEAVRTAVAETPRVLGVGGGGATVIDFDHAIYGNFPIMLALIGIATFLLLTRAFRSPVLAAKAVLFNLVSLAAAYGVLTWVWQQGHASSLVWGIPATGAITMWVPLMLFAFLYGLSMDYEVFILARIRESYDRTGDPEQAVREGIGRTGRLVTSAAAILMLGFTAMATSPQTDLKILATGLGAGILIDAVVIRCLLVPAMVALLGNANWWMPSALARLIRVSPTAPQALRGPSRLAPVTQGASH